MRNFKKKKWSRIFLVLFYTSRKGHSLERKWDEQPTNFAWYHARFACGTTITCSDAGKVFWVNIIACAQHIRATKTSFTCLSGSPRLSEAATRFPSLVHLLMTSLLPQRQRMTPGCHPLGSHASRVLMHVSKKRGLYIMVALNSHSTLSFSCVFLLPRYQTNKTALTRIVACCLTPGFRYERCRINKRWIFDGTIFRSFFRRTYTKKCRFLVEQSGKMPALLEQKETCIIRKSLT